MISNLKLSKAQFLTIGLILVFDLLIMLGIYVVASITGTPIAVIVGDPGTRFGNVLIGMLSNFCIMIWAAAAAICYLSAFILRGVPSKMYFMLASGLITTLLALDDAFLFHEGLFRLFIHYKEKQVYMLYVLLFLIYMILFIRTILNQTNYPILALSFLFMGTSIVFDVFIKTFPTVDMEPLVEEGAKLVGVTLWLAYFFMTAIRIIKPHIFAKVESQSQA